jgi:hypothetical protein
VRVFVVGLLSLFAVSTASADDLAPLEQLLNGQPEESYQHVRCAGFYLANIEWGGQALSESMFEESKAVISALLLVATLQRASKMDGDIESLALTVNADARAIADLYAINYRQSYAVRGAAWDGNPLWESDAGTCKPIGEVALQLQADLEQGQ